MKQQTTIFLILFATLLLSGCSSLNSKFDCPMTPGIRCESLDQVNARVDSGEISDVRQNKINTISSKDNESSYFSYQYSSSVEPTRTRDSVMHVWIAPYEDKSGNYHQESDIYTVVKSAHWMGNPPKESVEE